MIEGEGAALDPVEAFSHESSQAQRDADDGCEGQTEIGCANGGYVVAHCSDVAAQLGDVLLHALDLRFELSNFHFHPAIIAATSAAVKLRIN